MSVLVAEPGEIPDGEWLIRHIASEVVVGGAPLGIDNTGTRTPSNRETRFVHVVRASGAGGMSRYGDMDTVVVYVASWAESRAVSREITQGLRRRLLAYEHGGTHAGVHIHRITESSAPAPMPVVDEDERRVEGGYTVLLRRHRGAEVRL